MRYVRFLPPVFGAMHPRRRSHISAGIKAVDSPTDGASRKAAGTAKKAAAGWINRITPGPTAPTPSSLSRPQPPPRSRSLDYVEPESGKVSLWKQGQRQWRALDGREGERDGRERKGKYRELAALSLGSGVAEERREEGGSRLWRRGGVKRGGGAACEGGMIVRGAERASQRQGGGGGGAALLLSLHPREDREEEKKKKKKSRRSQESRLCCCIPSTPEVPTKTSTDCGPAAVRRWVLSSPILAVNGQALDTGRRTGTAGRQTDAAGRPSAERGRLCLYLDSCS
ncbi:hypothetical protein EYF80_014304 [Liparis tanakae]|uniref:Uncharacterized protein n=1 Tax=Liparis tanakae TaxID=230148 RepID=A0A4Z2IDV4_9TELE|nr:hypothetical protein EYF80_014304 [Liparis tanakae]